MTLLGGAAGTVPTKDQLLSHGLRHIAGAGLVLAAAELVHRAGYPEERWQYVAIAAALVPQVLTNAVAVRDPDRRRRLRTSSRPAPLLLAMAVLLVVAAVTLLVSGSALAPGLAGLCAALGLGVAASPTSVRFGPRP